MKTFKRIPQANKDYLFIVEFDNGSSIQMKNTYSYISGTYTGTKISGYVETVRLVLAIMPNFLEEFDGYDPINSLKLLGFIEVEPTKLEFTMYSH